MLGPYRKSQATCETKAFQTQDALYTIYIVLHTMSYVYCMLYATCDMLGKTWNLGGLRKTLNEVPLHDSVATPSRNHMGNSYMLPAITTTTTTTITTSICESMSTLFFLVADHMMGEVHAKGPLKDHCHSVPQSGRSFLSLSRSGRAWCCCTGRAWCCCTCIP